MALKVKFTQLIDTKDHGLCALDENGQVWKFDWKRWEWLEFDMPDEEEFVYMKPFAKTPTAVG